MASLIFSYMLWLFGGLFGLHHLHLKRPKHAFLAAISLNGFGFGWLRDMVRIPSYVEAENEEPIYIENMKTLQKFNPLPKMGYSRPFAQIAFAKYIGSALAAVLSAWLPASTEEAPLDLLEHSVIMWAASTALFALGGAWAIQQAGEVGQACSLSFPRALLGMLAGIAVCMVYPEWRASSQSMGCILGVLWCNRKASYSHDFKKGPRKRKRDGCCATCTKFNFKVFMFVIILINWGAFNIALDSDVGEDKILLKDAFINMLKSPVFQEFWSVIEQINARGYDGWADMFNHLLKQLDADGSDRAFDLFGLDPSDASVTMSEVKAARKKLVLKYHPDKLSKKATDAEKKEYEEKFLEVQEAYEIMEKYFKTKEGGGEADTASKRPPRSKSQASKKRSAAKQGKKTKKRSKDEF